MIRNLYFVSAPKTLGISDVTSVLCMLLGRLVAGLLDCPGWELVATETSVEPAAPRPPGSREGLEVEFNQPVVHLTSPACRSPLEPQKDGVPGPSQLVTARGCWEVAPGSGLVPSICIPPLASFDFTGYVLTFILFLLPTLMLGSARTISVWLSVDPAHTSSASACLSSLDSTRCWGVLPGGPALLRVGGWLWSLMSEMDASASFRGREPRWGDLGGSYGHACCLLARVMGTPEASLVVSSKWFIFCCLKSSVFFSVR